MSQINPYSTTSQSMNAIVNPTTHYPPGYNELVKSFDYGRMFSAPFQSSNWIVNLLWATACVLLSLIVVGPIVLYGYSAEVAVARTGGRSKDWPDFDLNRISDYLMRGLWPFLWSLIGTFVTWLVIGIPAAIVLSVCSFLTQNEQTVPAVIVGAVGGLVVVFLYLLVLLVMTGSMIHSALGNDFLKGGTVLIVGIVTILAAIPLSFLGLLFCLVGMFVVQAYLNLILADAVAQFHDMLVYRGGRPAWTVEEPYDGIVDAQVL
jgi:Protein of unknown function (DUF4013)